MSRVTSPVWLPGYNDLLAIGREDGHVVLGRMPADRSIPAVVVDELVRRADISMGGGVDGVPSWQCPTIAFSDP